MSLAVLASMAVAPLLHVLSRRINMCSARVLGAGPVLLVIAHPDDESMFFAPTVAALEAADTTICVLCLSTGDFAGLGRLRALELPAACVVLGVPPARVRVLDVRALRDGPQRWPAEAVAECVAAAALDFGARAVITFDERGVSGHVNHRDTHAGVLRWAEAAGVECWTLGSPGWARKFSGPLFAPVDALVAWCRGRACFLTPSPSLASRALQQHRSQAVWFRSLFVLFAACAYVNTLARVAGPHRYGRPKQKPGGAHTS